MLNCQRSCLQCPRVAIILKTGQFRRRECWVSEATNLDPNPGSICVGHVPNGGTTLWAKMTRTAPSKAHAIAILKLVRFTLREFPHRGCSFNFHLLFREARLHSENIPRLFLAQIAVAQTDALGVRTCDCHIKLPTVAFCNSPVILVVRCVGWASHTCCWRIPLPAAPGMK